MVPTNCKYVTALFQQIVNTLLFNKRYCKVLSLSDWCFVLHAHKKCLFIRSWVAVKTAVALKRAVFIGMQSLHPNPLAATGMRQSPHPRNGPRYNKY